jgi:hypothetical protein
VLGPVRELRRAAVPEIVGTDAIDLPGCELAGLGGATTRLEGLRAEIMLAEDEADVGARTFERFDRARLAAIGACNELYRYRA